MRFLLNSTRILVSIILLCMSLTAGARKNLALSAESSARALIYSGVLPPLWHTALQEGRWDHLGGNQLLATASTDFRYSIISELRLTGNAEIDYSSGFGQTYLHSAGIGMQWKGWVLNAGKHTFDPIFVDSRTSSGSYLFGRNNRPVQRVTLQLFDYTNIPLTSGRIQVRGGISHGWLNDQPVNGDVLLHEKYAYARWNGGRWKPYAGLNHSSLYGGHKADDEDIAVDFPAVFMARGSEKVGGAEAINAAGAHMGLYDFGIFADTGFGSLRFYYQIPFADGSGMTFWKKNTDHVLGINFKPVNFTWLNDITFEWIQTTFQSGNGMPDPRANINGKLIHYKTIAGYDNTARFMEKHYGIQQESWTGKQIRSVIREKENFGNDFGGRDGYMNNGIYLDGWVRNGYVMGSPFHLTEQQVNVMAPGADFNGVSRVKNDRFNALYLGGTGNFSSSFTWEARLAYTRNFGSYIDQYPPQRFSWDEDEDYWFRGGRDQWYSMLQVTWKPYFVKGLRVHGSVGIDAGELYEAWGVKTGIVYGLDFF